MKILQALILCLSFTLLLLPIAAQAKNCNTSALLAGEYLNMLIKTPSKNVSLLLLGNTLNGGITNEQQIVNKQRLESVISVLKNHLNSSKAVRNMVLILGGTSVFPM